jgi:hypothetical protein
MRQFNNSELNSRLWPEAAPQATKSLISGETTASDPMQTVAVPQYG